MIQLKEVFIPLRGNYVDQNLNLEVQQGEMLGLLQTIVIYRYRNLAN